LPDLTPKVVFAARIDLAQGTLRCNCSICAKLRFWPAIIASSEFSLLSGEDGLADYQFLTRRDHHYFCRHCGVHPFWYRNIAPLGRVSCGEYGVPR
jgi:hypothetical protein